MHHHANHKFRGKYAHWFNIGINSKTDLTIQLSDGPVVKYRKLFHQLLIVTKSIEDLYISKKTRLVIALTTTRDNLKVQLEVLKTDLHAAGTNVPDWRTEYDKVFGPKKINKILLTKLITEREALLTDMSKLHAFVYGDKFPEVSQHQQMLLVEQLGAMTLYSNILSRRIDDVKGIAELEYAWLEEVAEDVQGNMTLTIKFLDIDGDVQEEVVVEVPNGDIARARLGVLTIKALQKNQQNLMPESEEEEG